MGRLYITARELPGSRSGAYGEFTFDVATRSISLDYNERFTSSEYYGHEF